MPNGNYTGKVERNQGTGCHIYYSNQEKKRDEEGIWEGVAPRFEE